MKYRIIFLVFFLCFFVNSYAEEYFYQWVDKNGNIHVTDSESNVPKAYQDSFKKIPKGTITQTEGIQDNSRNLNYDIQQTEKVNQQWHTRISSEYKKKKKLIRQLEDKEAEYNARSLRSPQFYNQTYAEKRKTLDKLSKEIEELKKNIEKLDGDLGMMKEEARREGVPPRYWEVEDDSD